LACESFVRLARLHILHSEESALDNIAPRHNVAQMPPHSPTNRWISDNWENHVHHRHRL